MDGGEEIGHEHRKKKERWARMGGKEQQPATIWRQRGREEGKPGCRQWNCLAAKVAAVRRWPPAMDVGRARRCGRWDAPGVEERR
ncbi:hypothetical protein AMTR_s00052p00129250 [Amborella trichopoda]|uniref:Uncharacterized protein n=1 Tax=Amborella trichopoda TaxID=13333 RepID=U5D4P5_AMBTC|nr:hypothetical protein AMTR_s00052p00129250 [Amborella trichopoda]